MFGKVFASMYKGTLYGQWQAIITMQQLIVLADAEGVIDMTPPAISAHTSIPLDIIETGLKILQQPDPYSRTPDNEGRRIELIDPSRPWGWVLVNHKFYRDLASEQDRRDKTRERVRKFREKQKESGTSDSGNAPVTPSNASNAIQKQKQDTNTDTKEGGRKRPLPADFSLDDGLVAYANAKHLDPQAEFEKFQLFHRANGSKYSDWRSAYQKWCIKAVEFREKDKPRGGLGTLE